jgi:hypothetical protein
MVDQSGSPMAVRGWSIVVRSDDNLLRNRADLHLSIDSLDSESHRDRTAHESLKTTFGLPAGLSYGSSYLLSLVNRNTMIVN